MTKKMDFELYADKLLHRLLSSGAIRDWDGPTFIKEATTFLRCFADIEGYKVVPKFDKSFGCSYCGNSDTILCDHQRCSYCGCESGDACWEGRYE